MSFLCQKSWDGVLLLSKSYCDNDGLLLFYLRSTYFWV